MSICRSFAIFISIFLAAACLTFAQSRQKFDGFSIEVNKFGKATAVFFDYQNGVGCSNVVTENGTITKVTWDIVPSGFTVRFRSGNESFQVGEALGGISNVGRAHLADLFRKGNRVRVASRGCGSGLVPELLSLRIIR